MMKTQTMERQHLKNFRRECASFGLPTPDADALCECAVIKPSTNAMLGTFFGENATQLVDILDTAADCQLAKRSNTDDGLWGLELATDEETGETYPAVWYFSFIKSSDGTLSIAQFALEDEDAENFAQMAGWGYVG